MSIKRLGLLASGQQKDPGVFLKSGLEESGLTGSDHRLPGRKQII